VKFTALSCRDFEDLTKWEGWLEIHVRDAESRYVIFSVLDEISLSALATIVTGPGKEGVEVKEGVELGR
jgi:hypothetical protein